VTSAVAVEWSAAVQQLPSGADAPREVAVDNTAAAVGGGVDATAAVGGVDGAVDRVDAAAAAYRVDAAAVSDV